MASACIPINEILERGTRGKRLWQARRRSIVARIRMWLLVPRVLRFVNDNLSGEKLGLLDRDQAASVYRSLEPLYNSLVPWVQEFPSAPRAVRVLFGWWLRRMEKETERLGDVLETLAWGSHEELRGQIDSAIEKIESTI